jgi:signal transduction histidine kinase/DNA-binding response OmpR family regulator
VILTRLIYFLIFVFSQLFSTISLAEPPVVTIDPSIESIELSPYLEYLQESTFSIDDALATADDLWTRSTSNIFKVPTSKKSIWVRFTVFHEANEINGPKNKTDWLFSIYNAKVKVNATYFSLGGWNRFTELDQYDLTNTDTPLYFINLIPGYKYTVYTKIRIYGNNAASFKIIKKPNYIKYINTQYLLEGVFYGSLFIMFLFTQFIYVKTKQKAYLYYSLYAIAFGYSQLINDSMLIKILSDYSTTTWFTNLLTLNSYYYLMILYTLFMSELFDLKVKSIFMEKVINVFVIFMITMVIVDLSYYFYGTFSERLVLLRFAFIIYLSVIFSMLSRLIYINVANAKTVLISILVPMAVGVFVAFNSSFEHPYDPHTLTILFRYTMVLSFIFLAAILADLFNNLEGEKKQAEKNKIKAEMDSHSKSQFLANMSHEIRTPLTAIIGYSETIRDSRFLTDTKRTSYLDTVISSSHHLLKVINDILDVSKIESNKMTVEKIPVSIADLVFGIQSLYEPLVSKKGLSFNLECVFPIPVSIIGDQTRLNQVVMNLLSNSLKFTSKGKIILKISYSWAADILSISVIDTGVGMTDEQTSKIFESFTQADDTITRKHGGTGLGLTIAKELCELMNGTIEVESSPGVGSSFTVKVKVTNPVKSDTIDTFEQLLVLSNTLENIETEKLKFSSKVLIAEDNKEIQYLLVSIMQDLGCTVVACDNGSDAFIEFYKDKFDIILTDINMPIISGTTLVKILRSNGETLPVIAITANVMAHEVQEYLSVGCSGVIPKPVDRQALEKKMMEYLPYTISSMINPIECFEGRVLIAEDNLANQEYIVYVLEEYGLQVTSVADGESALEQCLSNSFDLVLLDLNMPKASGFEVVSTLISMSYSIPCYALTADDSPDTSVKCIESGFVGCLNKPIDKNELSQIFRLHLCLKNTKTEDRQSSENFPVDSARDSSDKLKIKFTESLPGLLSDLETAGLDGNWSAAIDIAHQIKGAGGSFGYNSLTEIAKELEGALKNEDEINDSVKTQQLYQSLITRLKQVINGYVAWQSNQY